MFSLKSLIILITLFLSVSCDDFEPEKDGCDSGIYIETRTIDEPSCGDCDGQVIFSNPPPNTAQFSWSHDVNETGHNVGNLCAGVYTITVTVGAVSRVTQVVVN